MTEKTEFNDDGSFNHDSSDVKALESEFAHLAFRYMDVFGRDFQRVVKTVLESYFDDLEPTYTVPELIDMLGRSIAKHSASINNNGAKK